MQLGSAILGAEMRHVSDLFVIVDTFKYSHMLTASIPNAAWSTWTWRPTAKECPHHYQETEREEGHCRCHHCQLLPL